MSTPPSILQQLWDQADRLVQDLPGVLEGVHSKAPDVNRLLTEQAADSVNSRTEAIYAEALEKHDRLKAQVSNLVVGSDQTGQRYKRDTYQTTVQEMLARLSRVDVKKLANDELLAQCTRARETIEATPDTAALPIASVHVTLYSVVYCHDDVLSAFLGRPSTGRRALETTGSLVKAIAADVAGTVVPFLATLGAVFDLLTPRIEREAERMRDARQHLDLLFQFDDQLTALLAYAGFAEKNTDLANQSLTTVNALFEQNAGWLIGVLRDAEQA